MALVALGEALELVLAACPPLPPVRWPLADALGCVLAEPVTSLDPVPPFAGSAMDGIAVRAADTAGASADRPVELTVTARILAGEAPDVHVGPGEAVRIMTGAPIPAGADAIVMVERTESVRSVDGVERVRVLAEAHVGDHVRPAGDDLLAGQVALDVGTSLGPAALGVAASAGAPSVVVRPRPRVGVLSTGDELVAPGVPLGPGQIRDSNRIVLRSLLATDSFEPVDLGRVPDDEAAITAAVQTGVHTCDAVISSGGVSMGEVDLVKVVLDRIGSMRWLQIAIKPAKPFAFGTVEGPRRPDGTTRRVPVFGLPGNPVSSAVSYELLARPGLRRLAGHADDRLVRGAVPAVAVDGLARRPDGKVHYVRVRLARGADGRLQATSAGGQGSHQLAALAAADGLAVLPDGAGVAPGGTVDVLVLREPSGTPGDG